MLEFSALGRTRDCPTCQGLETGLETTRPEQASKDVLTSSAVRKRCCCCEVQFGRSSSVLCTVSDTAIRLVEIPSLMSESENVRTSSMLQETTTTAIETLLTTRCFSSAMARDAQCQGTCVCRLSLLVQLAKNEFQCDQGHGVFGGDRWRLQSSDGGLASCVTFLGATCARRTVTGRCLPMLHEGQARRKIQGLPAVSESGHCGRHRHRGQSVCATTPQATRMWSIWPGATSRGSKPWTW